MMPSADAVRTVGAALLSLGGGTLSRHLDEMIELDSGELFSGAWCISLFRCLQKFMEAAGDSRALILVIPVSTTNHLNIEHDISINAAEFGPTPPTVYLFEGDDFFAPAQEEYRTHLVSSESTQDISIVYRSWRDFRSAQHGWEYNNDIYIWHDKRVVVRVG